jgi:hypothetical protein
MPSGKSALCGGEIPIVDECGEGLGCAVAPPQPFAPVYCIATDGSASCPAAWPTKVSLYDSWEDTRGCKGCECGIVEGTCSAVVEGWAGAVCGQGTALGEIASGTCKAVSGLSGGLSVEVVELVGDVGCGVTKQGPTGTLTPSIHTTVCCAGG